MSDDIYRRFKQHQYEANTGNSLPVYAAMRKHSYNFEIIEECQQCSREELSQKEVNWIKYYDSTNKEKGYNIKHGGDGADTGCNNLSAKLNEEQLLNLYDDLINHREIFIYQLSEKYNLSKTAISAINNGRRYYNEKLNYPLRPIVLPKKVYGTEHHLAKFDKDVFEKIVQDLKDDKLSLEEMSKKYNCSSCTISHINTGKKYYNKEIDYPIRKKNKNLVLSYNEIYDVYKELIYTNHSYPQIAKKFNVSDCTIGRLNNGQNFKDDNFLYPIRKNKEENKKAVSTISESGEQDNY